MPKKNILMSSGSTRTYVAPSNKFTYDTDTGYVSVDNISSSNFAFPNAANSILVSSGGIITPYIADISNKYVISDGNKWGTGQITNAAIGIVDGDLTGSLPNPTVKNLSNVATGSLPIQYGGFSGSGQANVLSSVANTSIIIANNTGSLTNFSSGSGLDFANNTYILASVSGTTRWAAVTASAAIRDANVQYFTCSNNLTSSIQTWTKANPDHSWARIMLLGGGGAGATGSATSGGGGGGSAGFTDISVYVANITSGTVTVGAGGAGSVGSTPRNGVSSSFSATNIFLSANGGSGALLTVAGNNGNGFTLDGVDGGAGSTAAGAVGTGGSGAGAGGGGGTTGGVGGASGLYYLTASGGTASNPGTFQPNLYGYTIPIGFGSGGGGGGTAAAGGSGSYGAGGGGGGRNPAGQTNGGDGGSGFVVVVSY
jgi:hypothetical protein